MKTIERNKSRSSLFMTIGLTGFLVVLLGFGKTLPQTIRNAQTPFYVYIHALLAFSWLSLFMVQSYLVRYNKFSLHKKLGLTAFFTGILTAASIIPVALFETRRELSQGLDNIAYSNMMGSVSSAVIFLSLVISGFSFRKKKEIHKRFMLLATIFLLWPAWFRIRHYFPSNPDTEAWFVLSAFSLIVIAWIWEKINTGRIHPTLLYVGLFIILEAVTEQFILYGGNLWSASGKTVYSVF